MTNWEDLKDALQGGDDEWNWYDVPAVGINGYFWATESEGRTSSVTDETQPTPKDPEPSIAKDAIRKVLGLDGKPGVTDNAATIAMWAGIIAVVVGGIYVIATFKPLAKA